MLALPYLAWLSLAFLLPLGAVALLSVQPGGDVFAPLVLTPTGAQYAEVLGDAFLLRTLWQTLALGAGVTAVSAVLAYPVALWLVRLPPRRRSLGFACVLVPLLTNVVVRSLGIILLLGPGGVVGGVAGLLGLGRPNLLFGWFAVGLSLTQVFLPYMVLSLYDALDGQDARLHDAAAGLGAGPAERFLRVVLPLSLPGLRAGIVLVFLLASTAYVSATLVGGRKVWVSGMVVLREGLENLDYPLAAAVAMLMLAASVAVTAAVGAVFGVLAPWATGRPRQFRVRLGRAGVAVAERVAPVLGRVLLAAALLLLLFPLALVVVSSFNDTPQATVASFQGFTWRWYGHVWDNPRYLEDARTSALLALASVVAALGLSLPAAFALARGQGRGHGVLAATLMLPLALPGIALGLGMLRLLQWFTALPPFLGLLAVHVVLVAPFTLAILRASVAGLDRSLEDAASGLGAGRLRIVLRVLLPQLAPALLVAGVLGFLISFGEVTVTAFLTTARMQTLPVRIYAEAGFSLENTVNAVSTLLIGATLAALLLVSWVTPLDRAWRR